MTRTHRRASAAVVGLAVDPARLPSEPHGVAQPASESTAAELGVTFDGRQFRFDHCRYDRMEDAVAYARLLRKRGEPAKHGEGGRMEAVDGLALTLEQRGEMASLGITLRAGRYHFRGGVYDSVLDALAHAMRTGEN